MKPFGERLVDLALSLLVATLLVSAAWSILRPLVPVTIAAAALLFFARRFILRRRL